MNILMLCYYYPPLLDVGCKRSVAFAENFKKHGWNPYVLSVRNPDKHYCLLGKETPPAGIPVEYTWSVGNVFYIFGKLNGLLTKLLRLVHLTWQRNHLIDLFCLPDIFVGWIPLTTIKAVKVIKAKGIDVIYVSCSPFSSAVIGVLLKKITGKPLVVDFRDPFALKDIVGIVGTPPYRAKINEIIEAWVIRKTDIFIVNTEEVKNAYLEQYPISKGKIHAVTNGFDFNYFVEGELPKFEKFTVMYAGLFYFFDKRNEIHTEAFFRGLALLKSTNQISSENFQFLYFGDEGEVLTAIAQKHSVADLVVCHERRPYPEVLRNLKRAHLQLLRISKPMISTKLFEGIALNIPFLATIPTGEVEDIIRRYSPASYIIMEGSPEELAKAIVVSRDCYGKGEVVDNRLESFSRKFSRENLSCKLMRIIDESISDEDRCKLSARILS